MQRLFFAFLCLMFFTVSAPLFSQEKAVKDPKSFHFFFGVGTHFRGGEYLDSSVGSNLFTGVGYSSFALQLELMGYSFEQGMAAESVYGDIDYNQDFSEISLGLHFKYYPFKNQTLAPYVGAFVSSATLFQSDSILDNEGKDDEGMSDLVSYGPTIGLVIFPTKLLNIFIESRYIKYSSNYSTYNLRSYGQTGEWEKIKGDSINLDSFYIGGGLSCSIF
ncbi:MAG: hypothetical protein PF637_01380 [Spirochaetes bacterium]|nr:hypothetical protein [Spirochaetota bacterium]